MNQATPYQIHQVLVQYAEGVSKAQTARNLGLHRETVAAYVKQYGTALLFREQTGYEPPAMGAPILTMPRHSAMAPFPTRLIEPVARVQHPNGTTEPYYDRRVYLLTAAQNNTAIHEGFWANLQAYAAHRGAEILVGGFIYRKNAQGQQGQEKDHDAQEERSEDWDSRLTPYRADDRRLIGPGLTWMGQMNALPTNVDPLSGLTNYSRGDSAVYPHVKIAMRSVPTAPGTDPKFLYTTGAVTVPNYIQRKSGQVAEFHHVIGALIVEVEGDDWFARQINATDDGAFQDLDTVVKDGRVTSGHSLFAINWGDVHHRKLTPETDATMREILDETRPQYQFYHDLIDAESANPHTKDDHLQRYSLVQKGADDVREELRDVWVFLKEHQRPGTVSVVVPSNHDDMIIRWLKSQDHKKDPRNMRFYHEASLAALDQIDAGHGVDLIKWFMEGMGQINSVVFLPPSKPTFILKGIEFGQHGHIGANGNRRPTAKSYTVLAIKINKGHEHTASIYDGVYTAGAMELEHGYNIGYSSWSRSLIFTYPNGKRTIITLRGRKYKGAQR